MKRNDAVWIEEILEQIELIQKTVKCKSKRDFENDLNLKDATIRRVEVIGEAIKNISNRTKDKHPEVEWKPISGTRDVLIHAYFGIDINILWKILENDIPVLKEQMKKIKEDLESQ